MMTDSEIELFIKQHASIEKGITLAIAWQQVLVLRDIADALMEMANPMMKVEATPDREDDKYYATRPEDFVEKLLEEGTHQDPLDHRSKSPQKPS